MTTQTTAEVRRGSKKPTVAEIDGFRGRLITADHADYDIARAVWNGAIDRRPRLIARCIGTADRRPRPMVAPRPMLITWRHRSGGKRDLHAGRDSRHSASLKASAIRSCSLEGMRSFFAIGRLPVSRPGRS